MKSPSSRKKVLFFGTFDPLHSGHRHVFARAKALGEYLTVVVARDSVVEQEKHHRSRTEEHGRLAHVAFDPSVDEAMLGDHNAASYALLRTLDFQILAVGYDQKPSDEAIYAVLQEQGLPHVSVVRMAPYRPETYKSSLITSA